jgi:hypothetical protein
MVSRGKAIFFQSQQVQDTELNLLYVATTRENIIDSLYKLIQETSRLGISSEIKNSQIMSLILALRDKTYEVIDALLLWQRQYVHIKRPILFGEDYIIGMITKTDFIASIKMRHAFKFTIGRGNLFLLPIRNSRSTSIHTNVSSSFLDDLIAFSTPSIDRMIYCYDHLRVFLPEKLFNKFLPLESWSVSAWKPQDCVLMVNTTLVPSSTTTISRTSTTKKSTNSKHSADDNKQTQSISIETFKLSTETLRTQYAQDSDRF